MTQTQDQKVIREHATEPLLEVSSLAAGYGDLRVLWDISLAVRPGRVTVVLGRNGAGKTTLLSSIVGIVKPDTGTVRFQGQDITRTPAPRRTAAGLALVQEGKRVFRRRTVEQNLRIGGHTMARGGLGTALERAYEQFPVLGAKRKVMAGALSGGQQQMLAIASALMPGPSVLMLDEPSAGLAPVVVDEVLAAITRLKTEGMGVLLVEQLVDKALAVADDVTIIEHGRVAAATSIAQTDRDQVRRIYLGERSA
ncbi:ABC transporter ATP-binding protein [Streptomyces sp. NPDC059766]|uniref:ABC transporter ATP-binding protein n=1 Tax=Streptomyces sp. NPDC059766 TaxID=3346940 RepID=UPI0036521B49